MSEVNLIVCCRESMRECQCVIGATESIAFSLETIPVVADVMADTVPGKLFRPVFRGLRET